MATGNEYNTLRDLLKAIADAIRGKVGDVGQINAQDFPTNINAIVKASGNATANQVLSGVTFSNSSGESTGTMPQREQGTNTLSLEKDGTGIRSYIPYGYYPEYSDGKAYVYTDPSKFGNAGTNAVLSGVSFTSTAGLKVGGTMTNRGAWSTTINPGGSVTIPAGYHNGGGKVNAGSVVASSKIIGKNTNYKVTGRSGSPIDISSECSVPNARISMIIAGGVGINDSGSQIGSTSVKAITTAGKEYTCQYSNGYYKVPTDTTYKKVVVHHNNYGGSEMSHGVIGPILVFGY